MAARMTGTRRVSAGLVVVWFVGALSAPTAAQAPQAPINLTQEEAVRMANEQAPRVAEMRARETVAASAVTALRALALPSASATMQYLRLNHIEELRLPDIGSGGETTVFYPDLPNQYRARAEVSVPIYSFGRVASNVAAANAEVAATRADRRVVEADVRLEVLRTYWSLATARDSVRVLVQSLARTDAWVGDVRARVDTGLLPPNDVLSAQAQRARQQVRLLQAQNEESLAELDLARLIGVPPGTSIRTTSAVDAAQPQATELAKQAPAALVERAISLRAEAEGFAARSEGLQQAAKASLANLKPYILFTGSLEPQRPNMRFFPPTDTWNTGYTLDFKAVWPFYDGGRAKAQAAGQTAQANAVDARRREFEGLVGVEVRQRLLDLQFGRAAIAAVDEAIAAATEARRVVDERFRAGVATSTEVLDAQVALLEAELERTRLNAGLRLSEARLLRAVGER